MFKKNEKFVSFTSALKFVSGIISWVVLVILVLVAVMLVYYFFATKIYGEKGEDYKPAFSLYTILSASMEPNINVYDVIVDVNVKKPEDIKVGDVITFYSTSNLTADMTITHRVTEVIKDGDKYSYKTQGDANLIPDNANAEFKNVLGKVIFKIPQLGRIQEFLGQKGGWLVVIVIPALGIIIADILKIFRLSDAKSSVEKLNKKEERIKQEKETEKERIKNNLTEHYNEKDNSDSKTEEKNDNLLDKMINAEEKESALDKYLINPKEEDNQSKEETELPEIKKETIVEENETPIIEEQDEEIVTEIDLPAPKEEVVEEESEEELPNKDIPFELPKLADNKDKKD